MVTLLNCELLNLGEEIVQRGVRFRIQSTLQRAKRLRFKVWDLKFLNAAIGV